ncbi:MAG: serine/threonine protein kinase, partial [Gemmatimonadota bacterium]|nr:serine/threonine protein kinase [Gemmatimonadota bacterium]
MTVPASDPLIGQIIADRYHVTALIGEGGMGRVYVAEHVRMGRKSALKVMSPALKATADAITRFNREAANASRINHPNVAAIYDFGETADGLLYLAMEFVEGETLHALVNREGRLPVARAAQIAKGAADALAAAHHLGIIHRDLKPDNIMLTRQLDGGDWVKVVDFGIAKAVGGEGTGGSGGQTVTTIGVSLGTPEYMSPEQLAGEKLDPRTDVYSLGLVLFNMLTGDLPYPKLTSKETLVRRLTSRPASLAQVRPDVAWPPAVQAVLDRALDPEPERRYQNVAELGRDVVAAAAAPAPDDSERTVRVAPIDRPVPSLAPTGVFRTPIPSSKGPAGPGGTRPLARPEPKPASKGLWVAALAVLVAAGAYAAWHARRSAVPPAAPTVAVHDSAADSARAPADTAHPAATPPAAAAETVAPKPAPV